MAHMVGYHDPGRSPVDYVLLSPTVSLFLQNTIYDSYKVFLSIGECECEDIWRWEKFGGRDGGGRRRIAGHDVKTYMRVKI
jgi:hypothetical protein